MLAGDHDLVLVEGAGGLLVRFDDDGGTLADVAAKLAAPVLVVAAAGLGTLNATALTVEVLRARGLTCAGVVIGAWPAAPDLAACENLRDLPAVTGVPLLGAVADGAGALDRAEFARVARHGLGPRWAGDGRLPSRDDSRRRPPPGARVRPRGSLQAAGARRARADFANRVNFEVGLCLDVPHPMFSVPHPMFSDLFFVVC